MKKRLILTTGTFNLIHPGHISFLEDAASLGELHVFLDTDKRNKELKGHKALHSYYERYRILSSLRMVEKVHPYSGPNKDFIEKIRVVMGLGLNTQTHISHSTFEGVYFVKAGDYDFDSLDQELVKVLKGNFHAKFLFLEYDKSYSTTKLFGQIFDAEVQK